MGGNIPQPEYVIVPCEYEAQLLAGHREALEACHLSAARQLSRLKDEHKKELLSCEQRIATAMEEVMRLKKENMTWRRKAVLYKMRLASSVETAQLTHANLNTCEDMVRGLTEERENLLLCNKALQEQVQSLTTLCQGQHRAKVQQQGMLAVTNAEAQQLHSELVDAHALSELLSQQLEDTRTVNDATRRQLESVQLQLEQAQAQMQAQQALYAAQRAECSRLQDALKEEKEALATAEVRNQKLVKELGVREAERDAAEQRLARHLQNVTQRDEVMMQQIKSADAVVTQQLRDCIDKLQEQLQKERQGFDVEQRRYSVKLEQEVKARHDLEQDCAHQCQRLREELSKRDATLAQLRNEVNEKQIELELLKGKVTALEKLRRQMSEKETELDLLQDKIAGMERFRRQVRDQEAQLELLQDKLAASERKAELRASQVSELEEALERSKQRQGHEANTKDAATAALQEQVEQQRRALEKKDALLRETEAAHTRQMENLQKRLADCEASARDQEAKLRQQLESTRQKAAEMDASESRMQQRVAELEVLLKLRDERIRHLEEGRAAESAQRDEAARQQQRAHQAEVVRLEARIRQLELQAAVMPSPAEPQRNQVRTAAAAVDKLMDNLLGGNQRPGRAALEALDDDDDDDERGPSAELILKLSQTHALPGSGGTNMSQQPAPAVAAPRSDEPEPNAQAGTSTAEAAGHGCSSKRPQEQTADLEENAGSKGRGRKAARGEGAAANAAAAVDEGHTAAGGPAAADDDTVEEEPQQQPARGGRPATRRRAAQAGQAKSKAIAAALAGDSESETVASEDHRAGKPATRAALKRGKGSVTVAQEGEQQAAVEAEAPAPRRRGRQAKVANAQNGGSSEAEPALDASVPVQPKGHVPGDQRKADAQAMPPPRGRAVQQHREHGGMLPHSQADETLVRGDEALTQEPAMPASQPQQQLNAGHLQRGELMSSVGVVAANAQSQAPAASHVSIFSHGLRSYEPLMAKNPLAAINHRVMEQVKSRVRLVPYTALQQLKPGSKVMPPSLAKNHSEAAGNAGKRPLPPGSSAVPGTSGALDGAAPSDAQQAALQQPPAKVGRTNR